MENWEVGTASYNLDEQHYNDADIIITNSSNSDYNNIRLDSNQTSEDSFDENKIIAKASCTSLRPIGANKDHIVTNDIYKMTNSEGINELGCFLWQRSIFYSKAYFGAHGFHLRWFSITPTRISSVPDRQNLEKRTMVYPQFNEVHIDEKRLIINIVHPVKGKRDFTLMAPNKAVFDEVTYAFQVYMSTNRNLGLDGVTSLDNYDDTKNERNNDADPHLELIEFPSHANKLETALWIFLLPIRVIMHYTLPDVRHLDKQGNPTKSVGHAYISVVMCLIWLILSSYAMVASLEALATLMAVIQPLTKRLHKLLGLTVSGL